MSAKSMTNLGRQRSTLAPVIGRCKIYGDPIRSGDDIVWLADPMGLSHRECNDRADAAAQAATGRAGAA